MGPCCEQTHAAFEVGLSLDMGQGFYSGWPGVDCSSQLRLCHTCIIDVMQGSWSQNEAHLGPTGPMLAPCWPHEPRYQGQWVRRRCGAVEVDFISTPITGGYGVLAFASFIQLFCTIKKIFPTNHTMPIGTGMLHCWLGNSLFQIWSRLKFNWLWTCQNSIDHSTFLFSRIGSCCSTA